ncbi:MAG: ribosome biogenesis protein [Nanoarchaeota archaeon]|nr:ribosome biogenesis protein [Nanoarchaeota archaeon]|tara:strand:+ start:420 stop:593 length:174 start_codon:yes stop_codon:yes gene_type:complete
MQHIHYCGTCEQYTMEKECPKCSSVTVRPRPVSLQDEKYDKYRLAEKKKLLKKQGLY